MTNRTHRGSAVAVAAVVALGLAVASGCGGRKKEADMPAVKPPVNQEGVHELSDAELDSLRAMKARLKVTRDEYWNDRGGVLGNDAFEVWYPPGKKTVSHGMYVLDHMMICRRRVQGMFGWLPKEKLTVVLAQTMEAYTDATGREWWLYARIDDNRITYQPVPILHARGLLDIAVPREYYDWYLRRFTHGHAPRWMIEGFASVLSDEWTVLEDNLTEFPGEPVHMRLNDIEKALDVESDRKQARLAYYNAMRMVDRLVQERGQEKVVEMFKAIADGKHPSEAAEATYGTSYDQLVVDASQWERGGDSE